LHNSGLNSVKEFTAKDFAGNQVSEKTQTLQTSKHTNKQTHKVD